MAEALVLVHVDGVGREVPSPLLNPKKKKQHNLDDTVKTCCKRQLKRRPKIGFQD